MLDMLTKFICSSMMAIVGFYSIKYITKSNQKLFNIKNIFLIFILILIPLLIHKTQYTSIYTIIVYLLSIIIYKTIFEFRLKDAVIVVSVYMILLLISDTINAVIFVSFFPLNEMRSNNILQLIVNITYLMLLILIIKIPFIKNIINKFIDKMEKNNKLSSFIFLVLTTFIITLLLYNLTTNYKINTYFIITLISLLMFYILFLIFLNEKNNNDKLTTEYDNLFNYVQNFEEWIEKEQLNRHEYKNQLAVLRCMTKDKKVINKIDEILEDSINIEGEVVNQLKALPKGGIKGLMYYKTAIAQKKKINLTIDVSLETKSILMKLTEKDIRTLCKLIGIYFDNAIEAALETRKKIVTIEIYELKDHVSFVISNTFKQHQNMDRRNEKGVSSKGEGHGNGLYFASKLISKNSWLSDRQDIVDKYYIQELNIKLPTTEKDKKKGTNDKN